ncbi:MAG TPA: molecular chaperone HtpG [Kouleothrix sp.]|uniref:molecular chaperone HtpG n=1 Tax=Kouleothrix sp. TaxID=2779161 RepID=UPI002BC45074|nr:molecular chaperone HtpG [Kouleothrix sp.]HRC74460.1 molecular chaperone HtpG [Kouleothrix sp.]
MTAETSAATEPTPVPFRAEVKQLLHILAHSLYTDREIFLRELISNASDALYRVQFEMLTNQNVRDAEAELAIRIQGDDAAKTITITDTGIGMTREELIENLGTIAQSSARALMERLEAGQRSEIIGQFGVGFYSAFVVADEVTVISRSFRPEAEAAQWRSHGGDTFTVEPAERAERGTTIILRLKDDAAEFAQDWKLRQIIKKHSDFVAWPVYVGDERANQQTALWRQQPRNVEAEKYPEFYRQLTMDFEEPLLHVHLSTDAPVDLHTILFVPARRERGLIERRIEGKIKLYSRKVLIQEEAKDLLPSYFRFVEGVVDSEDLPLNVSREMVQSNPVLARIKKSLTGRLTKELGELATSDAEKYAAFWKEFGVFLKEGIAVELNARTDLLPLLRFHSTKSGDGLTSLAEYKSRMIDGQSEIYYVMGSDLESIRHSPHLEALEERGLEALLFVEMMDGFMLSGLREYEGHKLRNVDDPNLALPGEAKPGEVQVSDEQFAQLVNAFKQQLGERVASVRASNVLRTSPARLVSPDDAPNREMERIQRMLERDFKVPARIIELNRGHALIADLARLLEASPSDPLAGALIEQIYESALLIEGLHPNPAAMVERIQKLMEAAARRG